MTTHREFSFRTTQREQFLDITARVRQVVRELGVERGVAHIYSPHTTAGIVVQENADPDLRDDLLKSLQQLVPRQGWRHKEGNADAHIKAMLVGTSVSVPVEEGKLLLGQWQDIYFTEFDGPRDRTVVVSALEAAP